MWHQTILAEQLHQLFYLFWLALFKNFSILILVESIFFNSFIGLLTFEGILQTIFS